MTDPLGEATGIEARSEEIPCSNGDGPEEEGGGLEKYFGVMTGVVELGNEVCVYACIYAFFFFSFELSLS